MSDTDKFGTTALEAAIQSQHAPSLTRFFKMMPGIYDAGALCASIATEQNTITEQLITNRGNKPIDHELEATAIALAADSGNLGLLRSLLKHPPSCKFGPMPLTPERGSIKRLEYNRTDSSSYLVGGPLALVARKNLDEVIEVCSELLKKGFQPDRLTWAMATYSNNLAFARFLLSHNQVYKGYHEHDPNQSEIPTPLDWAIGHNNKEFVTLLLRAGAEVNEEMTLTRGFVSPLQLAVTVGDLEMVRCLVDAGANVNGLPAFKNGGTALQSAALHGHLVIAKYLLDLGAQVNAMPSRYDGRSALEAAAEYGRLDMLELLLASGAQKTGNCHRLYVRAVTRATVRGHHTAANLLKQSLGWSEQDEKMALTKSILSDDDALGTSEVDSEDEGFDDHERDILRSELRRLVSEIIEDSGSSIDKSWEDVVREAFPKFSSLP